MLKRHLAAPPAAHCSAPRNWPLNDDLSYCHYLVTHPDAGRARFDDLGQAVALWPVRTCSRPMAPASCPARELAPAKTWRALHFNSPEDARRVGYSDFAAGPSSVEKARRLVRRCPSAPVT